MTVQHTVLFSFSVKSTMTQQKQFSLTAVCFKYQEPLFKPQNKGLKVKLLNIHAVSEHTGNSVP